MKKIIFIFLLLVSANCFAQEKNTSQHAPKSNKRVIVIPFEEKTYFNDASDIIAEKDKISHKEILNFFRTTLNAEISKALSDSCRVINMLNVSDTRIEESVLDSIYSMVSYEFDIARPNNYQKEDKKIEKIKIKKTKIGKTEIKNGEIIETRCDDEDKYLKIVFPNKQAIEEIARQRRADNIIFITGFEIKGNNYRDPYLSGNTKATRKIKVHFTIYDFSGHITHGGFAETNIPFNLNKKQEIVDSYFPEIIRQITSNIKTK